MNDYLFHFIIVTIGFVCCARYALVDFGLAQEVPEELRRGSPTKVRQSTVGPQCFINCR